MYGMYCIVWDVLYGMYAMYEMYGMQQVDGRIVRDAETSDPPCLRS